MSDRERERSASGSAACSVTGPLVLLTSGTGSLTFAAPPEAEPVFQISADFRNVEDGMPSLTFSSGSFVYAPAASVRQPQRTEP